MQDRPDYLKVTKLDSYSKLENLPTLIWCHKNSIFRENHKEKPIPIAFGFFNEILEKSDYSVLQFDPYSLDMGFTENSTLYKTREEALEEAIKYLRSNGYLAKPFDLEGMIEKV